MGKLGYLRSRFCLYLLELRHLRSGRKKCVNSFESFYVIIDLKSLYLYHIRGYTLFDYRKTVY